MFEAREHWELNMYGFICVVSYGSEKLLYLTLYLPISTKNANQSGWSLKGLYFQNKKIYQYTVSNCALSFTNNFALW